ncbi:MAG: hypothetical protein Q4G25_06515 [Paracoccus sp. (in: a-proteobacteria)]|nr:hypothetical protein [Paracoccus sp. (in: a-proteobacteria)]
MSWFEARLVAERLQGRVPDLVSVGLARDFGAARIETIRTPSAWVPERRDGG